MITNIQAAWQAIFVFSASLGYAIGNAHGAAIGLAIASGVGAFVAIVKG